jgi:anti-sigma regulatory factor (Ser/Thr protein kinase)
MREISLHILDIVQNSIDAGASKILISVVADRKEDKLTFCVEDNGKGMTPELLAKVTDPFVTTRKTRRIGLGIPMLVAAAEQCNGKVDIRSEVGKGTTICATFGLSHIDRAPFGDITSTLISLIAANPAIYFRYEHCVDGKKFVLDTEEINSKLEDVPISEPKVIDWLKDYINQSLDHVGRID